MRSAVHQPALRDYASIGYVKELWAGISTLIPPRTAGPPHPWVQPLTKQQRGYPTRFPAGRTVCLRATRHRYARYNNPRCRINSRVMVHEPIATFRATRMFNRGIAAVPAECSW